MDQIRRMGELLGGDVAGAGKTSSATAKAGNNAKEKAWNGTAATV
jgi:hypothetical protein